MTNLHEKSYIGIDVAKDKLDVYLLPEKTYQQYPNTPAGIRTMIKQFATLRPSIQAIVMEATGGYERAALTALDTKGLPVHRVNPRQIRRFAQGLGYLAKTDKLDARVIAIFAQKVEPTARALPDATQQALMIMQQRRQQLIQMRQQERNRLEKMSVPLMQRSCRRVINTLEKELAHIDTQLQDFIDRHGEYQQRQALLMSAKGVGETTSTQLIASLPELGKLDGKSIAALVGVAPFNRDSGCFRGKRSTYGGRVGARQALYMATLVATRHNPIIKAFYQRLLVQGKAKMTALVACMRKFIVILNAMLRDNKPWQA